MLPAILTTVCFALSAAFAHRSIRAVGATRANLGRLLVAVVCLGAYAHSLGGGLEGAGRNWFLLSGLVGMGLGDLASFAALPLIGSRLTVLLTQCLAVPIGILAERLWLGTALTGVQLAWSTVIVGGVVFALMPSRSSPPRVTIRPAGFLWGIGAAAGQGLGAVISRKANAVTLAAGEPIDGLTAAYQRIVGGLVLTAAFFILREVWSRRKTLATAHPAPAAPSLRDYAWVPLNALSGAVLGVSLYQWALATTPSGLVLPIVACTPIAIIPLSRWLEQERPCRRSLLGGVIAVAGVIALTLSR